MPLPPILENKDLTAHSVFLPSALVREERWQKELPVVDVPQICILDPDGDIVRQLKVDGRGKRFNSWPCYHTDLFTFALGDTTVGILGCVVGAPFAVLIAEELFVCGCQFLLSLTSAGQILAADPTPYVVVIDRALRDEGTSYHYTGPAKFADADSKLVTQAAQALDATGLHAKVGSSWTTDAPFRETPQAIEAARSLGILAAEMEAAALYTFAWVRGISVLCLAHVANTMAQSEGDFEKGDAGGSLDALKVLGAIVSTFRSSV